MDEELTPVEVQFQKLIAKQVKDRAEAARAVDEHTRQIAELCVQARGQGVTMALLARCVKVWDPHAGEDGGLRSVSRQSVDQLVSAHEGRKRAPRKSKKKAKAAANGSSRVNVEAFV